MITIGKLPMTSTAKRVIENAQEESSKLKQKQVDTEHILLGLLREDRGLAGQLLMYLGLRIEEARKEIEKVLLESNDLEHKPSVAHPPAQSVVRADEDVVELPYACPNCGHSPVVRVVWGAYCLSDKDLQEITSGQAFLGSVDGGKKGPPWVCLTCAPKWSKVRRLAMEDYEWQLKKEIAIESQEFDNAVQYRDAQRELRSQLAVLYEELLRNQ